MIKKLSRRIFLIIMISLTIVVLGMILLFSFFNYRNTLNTSNIMMDRFLNSERRNNIEKRPTNSIDERPEMKPEDDFTEIDINIEGLYSVLIENSEVVEDSTTTEDKTIREYALKLANSKNNSGIIDKYIYKTIKTRDGIRVFLMDDEVTISHLKKILIFTIVASVLSICIIYIIAKQISKTIVRPVEETLEKQKQFISDASHELKTPLAVIEANADVLENETKNNKWLGYIQNEIESMDKLINELLLLAKIENVDNIKEYKQIDLSQEILLVTSMFESMAYEKNVKIKNNIQENIKIDGNKEDFEHIVSTLVDNAIKHSEEGKEVTVDLAKEKNDIILQVKNVGDAIPEEEREKIFERFYRIDKSRNRNEKRYGLGLAIAKSIVEKYKGKIEVSCKDGITIFKVTITI